MLGARQCAVVELEIDRLAELLPVASPGDSIYEHRRLRAAHRSRYSAGTAEPTNDPLYRSYVREGTDWRLTKATIVA
jgi:hypothetical protein